MKRGRWRGQARHHPDRRKDEQVTREFLASRTAKAQEGGYEKPRWVAFCEAMLDRGYQVDLYEAGSTWSKYITVRHNGRVWKVRYSNHKPSRDRERDINLVVGAANVDGWISTSTAIELTVQALDAGWEVQP